MSGRVVIEAQEARAVEEESGGELLRLLKEAGSVKSPQTAQQVGVVIGQLIGMTNDGRTPLVLYPGQPGTAALVARTVVDLHGPHVGQSAVLMFDCGNPNQPIVMGLLRGSETWDLTKAPAQVEVDVDGQRMLISAKNQLVLSCGRASITLTQAGKVLIQGSYVLSQSTGVNRIKGGSVDIN